METKEMKIQAPEGYEIDREKSTFEKIVFKKIENNLPKTWKEFGEVKGWFVTELSDVDYYSEGHSSDYRDKNLFPTEEEAKACVTLAQLCQLRDRYNDGWKPNWIDGTEKHSIYFYSDEIYSSYIYQTQKILTFKTRKLRDQFLENFRDLIEVAKPLL